VPASERFATCWGDVDALMASYHDSEWGRPCHDDLRLFEMLLLEGFQAGLSWSTILNKRENFRAAFAGFDPERLAAFGPGDFARLMADPGIVRNRLKVEGAARNARACLALRDETRSFDSYLWQFAPSWASAPTAPESWAQVPAKTPESDALSKDLRRRGFTFVGSTICYAFMQSVGMVNDHLTGCPVREQIEAFP
jgi:DNA-3-methyladenine glycosylase I